MNRLLLDASDCLSSDASRARICDQRLKHLRQVLKVEVGDSIRVGLINGPCGNGIVKAISEIEAQLELQLDQTPPAKIPLIAVIALPRPKVARRILHMLAELGVEQIVLLNSWRVEKSFWQSPLLSEDHLRRYLLDGLAQSGDTVLPELSMERRFRPFVEDRLPNLIKDRQAWVAHPYADTPLPLGDPTKPEPSLLIIGPEGGFIPFELDLLKSNGVLAGHAGPRILRTETAVPSLISRLFPGH